MNDFIKNLFQPKDSFYVPVINREFYMFISIWDFSNIYDIAVLKSFFHNLQFKVIKGSLSNFLYVLVVQMGRVRGKKLAQLNISFFLQGFYFYLFWQFNCEKHKTFHRTHCVQTGPIAHRHITILPNKHTFYMPGCNGSDLNS
jgi:hypothetical protein